MQRSLETFTSSDGLSIYAQSWFPDAEVNGIVIIVHGYAEHSGRYSHVATTIVSAGYGAYALDHRGHGHSEGLRAHFDSMEEPIADLEQFFQDIQARHPDLPIFLLGHSMGSVIALSITLRHQDRISGLILSGIPLDSEKTIPGVARSLGNFVRNFAPKMPLFPAVSADTISSDPKTIRQYNEDPLVYRGAWRVGLAGEILDTSEALRGRVQELTLPLLVLHGEQDEISPVSGAKYVYENAASTDKTIHKYPGMRHEVFNELDRGKVLDELKRWLLAH